MTLIGGKVTHFGFMPALLVQILSILLTRRKKKRIKKDSKLLRMIDS
jgi:hypothetical protein